MMESPSENRLYRQEAADNIAESKRWADLISKLNAEAGSLKAVGSLKYSKEAKIGTGSSGSSIYGGKFENKYVAVKKILNETVQRESELYDLMKPKAMSNVLKILHIEKDEDFTYVVTELCEYDLKAVIEDHQDPVGHSLTPERRLKLCVDILTGLKELHSIDIIHRDLKPNNILINVEGDAFVADFGISRKLTGGTTLVTSCFGTMCWIAHEGYQSRNEQVRYKKASDVQVAGCLIYYVLSNGHHPFEATSPFINDTAKLMNNVAEGSFSLLYLPRYYAQCTELLEKMLDEDMFKRPLIDDCLKVMEAVRKSYISSIKKNVFTIDVAGVDVPFDQTRRKRRDFEQPLQNYFMFLKDNLGRDWKDLGRCLHIMDDQLNHLTQDYRDNIAETIYQMLICWQRQMGNQATLEELMEALSYIGRKDLAETLSTL